MNTTFPLLIALLVGSICPARADLVILGVSGIDQGIPSAPLIRDWIKKHGDEKLTR